MRKKIIIALVILLAVFGISRIDFRSPEEYYAQDGEKSSLNYDDSEKSNEDSSLDGFLQNDKNSKKNNKTSNATKKKTNSNKEIKVTIYIDVTNLKKKSSFAMLKPELRKYVPSSGYILDKQTISVREGATAFEVLQKATRLNNIQMEYQGANENIYNSVYIEGINHLYEFSAGNESGWMYSVNGTFPNYGMSLKTMSNGDLLRMVYTCDLGCDVGYSMKKCN